MYLALLQRNSRFSTYRSQHMESLKLASHDQVNRELPRIPEFYYNSKHRNFSYLMHQHLKTGKSIIPIINVIDITFSVIFEDHVGYFKKF